MAKFVKMGAVVDAIRWTGDNTRDVALWQDPTLAPHALPEGWWLKQRPGETRLIISTDDDDLEVEIGSWLIKPGAEASYMRCVPNEWFAERYMAVE